MRIDRPLFEALLLFAVPIAVAACILWISPFVASNLSTTPDSVEYATAAFNYAEKGVCKISYCGEWFSMRYPPWFSMFVLAPMFKIFGQDIGNAVIPIFIFGLFGVMAAFLIGRRLSDPLGGFLAALFLLVSPLYRAYSRVIMTDAPTTVLLLALALVFMESRHRRHSSLPLFFIAGLAAAVAASFRPATFAAALPFVLDILWLRRDLRISRRLARLAVFLVPSFTILVAALYYNYLNFGGLLRNGYNYWCPIPYDYPFLTFSFSYAARNAAAFLKTLAPFFCAGVVMVLFTSAERKGEFLRDERTRGEFRAFAFFAGVTLFCLLAFHLLYFYSELRFYLPVEAFAVVALGALASVNLVPLRFKSGWRLIAVVSAILAVCLVAVKILAPIGNFDYNRRVVVDEINSVTPSDAVVISSIDPIYLNFMTRRAVGSERVIIPTSREVEYASKLIAKRKPRRLDPAPKRWWAHRDPRLKAAGAREAVPWTANDNPNVLKSLAAQGRNIYIDVSHLTRKEFERFNALYSPRYGCVQRSKHLFELTSPTKRGDSGVIPMIR
ncbi:MAG: glycosyltransferase family 39 protein [Victivallales bacterium]|nr:glycosyltransferase family 39 protein [Victivallales bacterium]